MRLGTIEVVHSVECNCGHLARGDTHKRALAWMIWHLRFHCAQRPRPPLVKTLWGLWRWDPTTPDKEETP
jgi:hypothetical protein